MWLPVVFLLLAKGMAVTQAVLFEVKVSLGGIKGQAVFSQVEPGQQTSYNMTLAGPNHALAVTWRLHAFRVNYDVQDRCNVTNLGPRIFDSVTGEVSSATKMVSGMDLSGISSVEGASLVFLNSSGNTVSCTTLERQGIEYVTARSTFRKTILGQVIFRQQGTELTRVTGDLYWDGSESSERDLEWRIVEAGSGCSAVGAAYNPGGITGTCVSGNHSSCAIGDLTGKMGTVSVGATKGSKRWTKVDLNLPLSNTKHVLGKTLQLFANGQSTPLACAAISGYVSRTGVAVFENDGVTGRITMKQDSPLDSTFTTVSLNNLRSMAGGYHVHKYPIPQRLSKDQSVLCSDASVSGHFNPFGIVYNVDSPAAGASTEDMYEVGDLSKKYGLLRGLAGKLETYVDFNLPLFGINSVLGRSIVIHYDRPGGPRWICANIQDSAALTSVLATFTFPAIGYVLLQQRVGEEEEEDRETTLYYRLDYGDGASGPSSGHSWAVHQRAIREDDMLADNASVRCISAGEVFNPFSVSDADYAPQCQPSNPLRCQAGDLQGKHGPVSIRADPETPAIGFFTDVGLSIQGPHSVVGKSLVLKAANGGAGNLACANLLQVWPQVLEAKDWGQGAGYGSITFSQQVGVVQRPTTIRMDLQHVPDLSHIAYNVSTRSVRDTGDKASRCASLGGVYNPFEVNSTGLTKDSVPVGDLTGKFGVLMTMQRTVQDPSLDVWGPRGIGGRAFSLSYPSGSSVGCANTLFKRVAGGKLFTAKAVFTGEVTGHIMLTQYVYPGGAMTPTTVVVDLRKATGAQTERHNWHTHETPVGDDATASSGRCASTGGHYNPFKVNVKDQYSECKLTNPLRCELGDQSNKLGPYDMDSGPMVASDVYLPLAGPFGVIGRSFVVHVADRGAPRLACADIIPASDSHSRVISMKTPPTMDKAPMLQKIAQLLNTETYNVAAEFVTNSRQNCVDARVYFLGMEADMYMKKFTDMLQSDASSLGTYKPVKECDSASSAGAVLKSLCLLGVSLILGRLLL